MANSKKIKRVYVCPTCRGNGYLKFNTILSNEEMIEQCHDCDSQGEIYDYDDDFEIEGVGISIH
jgi:DnaJ-class molecular chaperone